MTNIDNIKLSYENFRDLIRHDSSQHGELVEMIKALEEYNGNYDEGIFVSDILNWKPATGLYPTLFSSYENLRKLIIAAKDMQAIFDDMVQTSTSISSDDLVIYMSSSVNLESVYFGLYMDSAACDQGLFSLLVMLRLAKENGAMTVADMYDKGLITEAGVALYVQGGGDITKTPVDIYLDTYRKQSQCSTIKAAQIYKEQGEQAFIQYLKTHEPAMARYYELPLE